MDHSTFVGLDVHKKRTSVALAEAGRGGEVRFHGEIPSTPMARSQVHRMRCDGWLRSRSGLADGLPSVTRPALAVMVCIGCCAA
jgi:hypothetical protein